MGARALNSIAPRMRGYITDAFKILEDDAQRKSPAELIAAAFEEDPLGFMDRCVRWAEVGAIAGGRQRPQVNLTQVNLGDNSPGTKLLDEMLTNLTSVIAAREEREVLEHKDE